MIGYLKGRLAHKSPPHLVVEVNGVGYEIEAPMSTFYALPTVGEDLHLFTHLAVRADAHTLYGFATDTERVLFRSLLRISGVGGRMALAILSGISVEGFVRCVQEDDTAALVRVPGVGKKTAERLIVEMRDRIAAGHLVSTTTAAATAGNANAEGAAHSALVALGYRGTEVTRMLKSIETSDMSAEEIIRRALQGAASQ